MRTSEGESYGCLVGNDEGNRGARGNVLRGMTRVSKERGKRKCNRNILYAAVLQQPFLVADLE